MEGATVNKQVNARMLEAGVAALVDRLPAGVLAEHAVEPNELVTAVYRAMAGEEWLPIATAPRVGRNLMLALVEPSNLQVGIGLWADSNDDTGAGGWSTESWWGKPPTHWRELPAPPLPAA